MSQTSKIFESPLASGYGHKLGIPFMRAAEASITVQVGARAVELRQELDDSKADDAVGIPSVVWDCGLLLADYLVSRRPAMTRVLDLGCGTGVGGVACALLGAREVCFSDKVVSAATQANIDALVGTTGTVCGPCRTSVCVLDWATLTSADVALPAALVDDAENSGNSGNPTWDLLVCSDVLYESSVHAELLVLLRKVSCAQVVLTYKRRHDAPEKAFLQELEAYGAVEVLSAAEVLDGWSNEHRCNITSALVPDLYAIILYPRHPHCGGGGGGSGGSNLQERVLGGGASLVSIPASDDCESFRAMGQLRYSVWAEEGNLNKGLFPDASWLDDMDRQARSQCRHYGVMVQGQLVAAARLTVHLETDDYRDVKLWRDKGVQIPFPVCDLGRLVVRSEHRRKGYAKVERIRSTQDNAGDTGYPLTRPNPYSSPKVLIRTRIEAAREVGGAAVICTATSTSVPYLVSRGFEDLGITAVFRDRPNAVFHALHLIL